MTHLIFELISFFFNVEGRSFVRNEIYNAYQNSSTKRDYQKAEQISYHFYQSSTNLDLPSVQISTTKKFYIQNHIFGLRERPEPILHKTASQRTSQNFKILKHLGLLLFRQSLKFVTF